MCASIEVADIFRAAGPAYRAAHAGHLSLVQLKVMSAIEHCRTAALGGHVEACEDCGHWRVAFLGDFRTPAGARNSSRKRQVRLWHKVGRYRMFNLQGRMSSTDPSRTFQANFSPK